jgi:hypothetical protein
VWEVTMRFGALPAGARATWFLTSIYGCQDDVLSCFLFLQMIDCSFLGQVVAFFPCLHL